MLFPTLISISAAAAMVAAHGTEIHNPSSTAGNATAGPTVTDPSGGSVPAPSGLAVPPCILACITSAATVDGCGSLENTTCICAATQFKVDAVACITTHCSPAELTGALQLYDTICDGKTPNGTATTTNIVPFSTPASNSTAAATSTTGTSSHSAGTGTGSVTASASATSPATQAGTSTGPAPTTPTSSANMALARGGAAALLGAVFAVALSL